MRGLLGWGSRVRVRPIVGQVRDAVEGALNEVAACPKHGRRMLESFMDAASKDLVALKELKETLNDDVCVESDVGD